MAIHEHSRGIPRVINVICDNVLLAAFAANRRSASREMVEEVCRDFDFARPDNVKPAAEPSALADPVPAGSPASSAAMTRAGSVNADGSMFESGARSEPSQESDAEIRREPLFGRFALRRRFSFFG
jgi:hypothetical protein